MHPVMDIHELRHSRASSHRLAPAASMVYPAMVPVGTALLPRLVAEDRVVPALLGLAGQLEHDVLDLRVLLERVGRHVLARTGLLETAVRHLGRDHEVVVDLDVAE